MLPSCNKFVSKDDISPNEPSKATLKTLLPVVEVAVFATYTGQIARNAGIFTQHFAGTDQQMIDVGLYKIVETDVTNDWTTIYNAGIRNVNELISLSESGGSPYYAGIGKINKALLLGICTDLWGDIPNKQAGLGAENLQPSYDKQEVVIADIQNLLSSAIMDLQASKSIESPGSDDLMNKGNLSKWIMSAWIIKARYANRLSKRDPVGSATLALSFLDSAKVAGFDEEAKSLYAQFSDKGNELNSWYAFNSQRGNYIKLSSTLVDTLLALKDPRLIVYARKDKAKKYSGTPLGETNTTSSSMGDYFSGDPAENPSANKLPLVTFVESKFIEAEASLRSGDESRAALAYKAAVLAAIERYQDGIPADSNTYYTKFKNEYLIANGDLAGTATQKLSQVMLQKWIAMFSQPEIWMDWRRTNFPTLKPNPEAFISQIPRRYPTEQRERVNNLNAVIISDLVTPVWWDK